MNILSLILIVPFLGALASLVVRKYAARIALGTGILLMLFGVVATALYPGSNTVDDARGHAFHLVSAVPWLSTEWFDMGYIVGIDGMSLAMLLLTILLGLVAILISMREIHSREHSYYPTLLATIGGVIGVFVSLDLILLFVMWEVVLITTFLLILLFGGENRKYASIKFLLYTGAGSAFLLFAIILLGAYTGSVSLLASDAALLPAHIGTLLLLFVGIAALIKMPIFPFHTWLPDAHVQAPTAGSILLAGVMLKMGAYALLRFAPYLPLADYAGFLFGLGVVTVLYGAWVCLAQTHLKRLIAFSSINHMGFVLMAIAAGGVLGTTGAVFQMVSHGLLSGLLFALAGVVHERAGTFDLAQLRGLVHRMPTIGWLLVLASLGSLGMPGMSGFVAEFLIIAASFDRFGLYAIIPVMGMILAGAYFLRLIAVLFGDTKGASPSHGRPLDDGISALPFALLLAAAFLLGCLPFLLLDLLKVIA